VLDPLTRKWKDATLARLARVAGGVSPMAITLTAFAVGIACAAFAARGQYAVAVVLWAANRVLDGLDGTVARNSGRQTDLGGYTDLVADFAVYAAVPLGVAADIGGESVWRAVALLLGAFYVNGASWLMLSAILEKAGSAPTQDTRQTSVTMPEGLIAGTETVVFYFLFLLFPLYAVPLFGIMAALVGVTALQRIALAVRRLR
jgi:phosphatidylglycerophosphate synthase